MRSAFTIMLQKFKTHSLVGKVMLTLLLGCTRANFGTQLREGHNSKQHPYCEMLWDFFVSAIQTKDQGLLSTGITILHNNAHSHIAANITESLCN
jgi:hypothetical protein